MQILQKPNFSGGGIEQEQPYEELNDGEENKCICADLCDGVNINDECEVCAEDFTDCIGEIKEAECICDELCSKKNTNKECEVCAEDFTKCTGKEKETECICGELCDKKNINEDCEVCADDFKDCIGEEKEAECICDEICSKKNINEDCDVCAEDFRICESDIKAEKMYVYGLDGTSADSPIVVPAEGLAFSNGNIYGISQEWYKEQKALITGNDDPEADPDFKLYVALEIPDEIEGIPVRTIEANSFTNSWSNDKEDNGAMYLNTSKLNIGSFSVVSVDMENADNLELIQTQAFYNCSDLKGIIVFPDSLKKFGESYVFGNCTQLEGVVWSDNLEYLGDFDGDEPSGAVFKGCTNLRFATTKEKYNEAKENGTIDELSDLTFPDSLKFIGKQCFQNAFQPGADLSVTIPSSVETIGSQAFYNEDSKEIRFNQFVVERTYDEGLEGYDYAAFKWKNDAAKDKVCLIIMADKASYDFYKNDANGHDYVENAVTYPLDVKFMNGSDLVTTELKLYNQYIQYELDETKGIWQRNMDYELPDMPEGSEPQPGYKDSVWIMDGKELTVSSKVTSDTVTLRDGELEDPSVKFQVKALPRNGSEEIYIVENGDTFTTSMDKYIRLDITPIIDHPLAGENVNDIFFWYRWNDSTDIRDNESKDFQFGQTINTLRINDMEDARTDSDYYQLDIQGKKVGTDGRPDYDWDGDPVYTSKDKQYYIKINLIESPENLAYIAASEYQDFVDEYPEYMLKNIYDTPEEMISNYLYAVFEEYTYIESENYKKGSLSIDWKLKEGTTYTNKPGETNTFIWTASQEEFDALGWTNNDNIPLTGELTVPNPYAVTFIADGNVIDTKYLTKGSTLLSSDFPAVPEKSGYMATWDITTDIENVETNYTVTAVYTAISYNITYDMNGGKNNKDNPSSYTVEDTIVLKNPTKSGYKFKGWTYDGQDEPEKDLVIAAGNIIGDIQFTANWSKDSGKDDSESSGSSYSLNSYFIKYHDGDRTINDTKYSPGEIVTVRGDIFDEPIGMTLAGWSLEEDGNVDYEVGDTFRMPNEIVDLYAVWEELDTQHHAAYINGYPDGTVGPDKTITRAEAASMFYNLMTDKQDHKKYFTDITEGEWYAEAVTALAGEGVINGYPDGTFRPNDPITRAEFVTMAMNFSNADMGTNCDFSDVSIEKWYYAAIAGATNNGWISGYPDGTFRPERYITRAEVSSVINRIENRSADSEFIKENYYELKKFSDLPLSHWAYNSMIEAANGHEFIRETGIGNSETWTEID